MNADEALHKLESETEAQTREEHRDLVELSGDLVNLYRRGLEVLLKSAAAAETWPLPDERLLEMHLLVKTAGALQGGRSLALRGYYTQSLGSARMILEDIAYLMYFSRRPDKAGRALEDPEFNIKIRNALEEHPDPEQAAILVGLYSDLSKATHPTALSMSLSLVQGGFRVERYVSVSARDCLIYLMGLAQHVCGVIRDRINEGGSHPEWLELFRQYGKLAEEWNAAQSRARGET